MPKPIKQLKRDTTASADAGHRVNISTSEQGGDIPLPTKAQISMLMSQLGKKGGKIGGKRRLETMTAKERSAAASNAAKARWEKIT
jgi:hypothetical protein